MCRVAGCATSCVGATFSTSGVLVYAYDDAGNLTQRKNAKRRVTLYSPASNPIDALNRVRRMEYQGTDATPAVDFSYDTCRRGKLCTVANRTYSCQSDRK